MYLRVAPRKSIAPSVGGSTSKFSSHRNRVYRGFSSVYTTAAGRRPPEVVLHGLTGGNATKSSGKPSAAVPAIEKRPRWKITLVTDIFARRVSCAHYYTPTHIEMGGGGSCDIRRRYAHDASNAINLFTSRPTVACMCIYYTYYCPPRRLASILQSKCTRRAP